MPSIANVSGGFTLRKCRTSSANPRSASVKSKSIDAADRIARGGSGGNPRPPRSGATAGSRLGPQRPARGVPDVKAQDVKQEGPGVVIPDALHDELGARDRVATSVAGFAVGDSAQHLRTRVD